MIAELNRTLRETQKELVKLEINNFALEIAFHGKPVSLWPERPSTFKMEEANHALTH